MKLVRRFVLLVIILAILVALAPMLFSGWARKAAETRLTESMGTPVTIADLELGWTSGAQITDLRIERSENHPTAIHVRSLDARPRIGALLRGSVDMPHLLIEGVEIRHAPSAASTEGGDAGDDPGGDEAAPAERAELPEIDLTAEVRDITIIYETPTGTSELRSIDSATARVKSGEPVTFAARYSGLKVDGTARIFDGRRMRETYTAQVKIVGDDFDLGKLAAAVKPWLDQFAGKLTIDETIDYDDGDLVAKGRVAVTGLVTGAEAARAPGQLDLRHDFGFKPSQKSLDMTAFDLRSSFGKVTAKGVIALDKSAESREDLTFDGNIDLAGLSSFLGDLMPMKLAGGCRANGTARRAGDTTHADVDVVFNELAATDKAGETTKLGRVTLAGKASWNAETRTLEIEKSDTDSKAVTAKISGRISMPEDGEISGPLQIDVDGNLDELGVFAESLASMKVGGQVTAKGNVVLGTDRSVDLRIGGTNVTAAGEGDRGDLGPLDFTGEAVGRTSGETLEFSKLLLKTPGIDFNGSGTRVVGNTTTVPVRAQLDFVRMQKLIQAFKPGLFLGGTTNFDGSVVMVDGTTTANLKGNVDSFAARGGPLEERTLTVGAGTFDVAVTTAEAGMSIDALKAVLTNAVTRNGPSMMRADVEADLSHSASGAFDVTAVARNALLRTDGEPEKRIPSALRIVAKGRTEETRQIVDDLRVTGDGITMNGSATLVTDGLAEVKANGDLDLDALSAGWLPLFLEGAKGSGKGRIVVDMRVPRGTSQEKGNGRTVVRLDHLNYDGADMKEVVFIVDMVDGVAKITRGTSNLNGGTLRLNGTVDTNGERPVFDVRMDAAKVELVKEWQPAVARIVPLFAGLGAKVTTFFSAGLSLKGSGTTWEEMRPALNGTGMLDCDAGTIKSPLMSTLLSVTGGGPDLAFDAIKTKFEVKDGAVHQDSMYIDGTIVAVRLGGITGLDGKLDYELGIKPKGNTPAEFAKFTTILDPEGFLPLGLGGTVDSPSLKMPDPAKLIGGAIKGAAKGALDGLLNGGKEGEGNPLDKIGGLLGGGDKDGEKKPNPLDRLGGLLGGGNKDGEKKDGEQKENPLDRLGGLLGGGNKDDEKKDGEQKENPLDRLGGLLGGGN